MYKKCKYIPYHPRSANSMVDEVQQFFETGTFVTSDVCDFLLEVISDAFNTVIHIYQQGADRKVKIHTLGGDLENPEKVVHLKFHSCENDKCSFLSTEGKKNILKFDNLRGNKVCRSCGIVTEKIKCPAIKMLEFNQLQGTLNVYHYEDHTCTPKDDRKKHDKYINEQIKKFPKMPPKQLQVHCIKEKSICRRHHRCSTSREKII